LYIHTIDIAHPALASEIAEQALDGAVEHVRNSRVLRTLKIIHGHGDSERPSVLKGVVQNWAYRNRQRFQAVIPGEEYGIFNPDTLKMRKSCGQVSDADLGAHNPGVTVIWVK
jgi:hypothetical protein